MHNDNFNEARQALLSDELSETFLADGTGVLLNIEKNQVLSLNRTGAHIVRMLMNEELGYPDLVRRMSEEYQLDASQAKQDVDEFITDLIALLH